MTSEEADYLIDEQLHPICGLEETRKTLALYNLTLVDLAKIQRGSFSHSGPFIGEFLPWAGDEFWE